MNANTETMLSLAALARRLDLPYPRALALVNSGVLKPSMLGPNNIRLFHADRVAKLRAEILSARQGGRIIS